MNKIFLFFLLICLSRVIIQAQSKEDTAAIKETVLNYVEGWYSGDADRMTKALHADLAKRGIIPSRDGSKINILKASFKEMIDWTGKNPNSLKDNKEVRDQISVIIKEIGVNIADVKCISKDFVDYLHLMRDGKEWKILNAIWEPNYKSMKKK